MGTSTSSGGGRAGSPFDPEWLKPESDSTTGGGDSPDSPSEENGGNVIPDGAIAPERRFGSARSLLGRYLQNGSHDNLRGATKSMVSKGMGGARRAAATMRGVASGVGSLGEFLTSVRDGNDQRVIDWLTHVRQENLSATDLTLEILKEVIPGTGSVDDESLRNAGAEAMAQLYELYPDVDIFNLTDAQIAEVMGLTIANEICNRIDLQLGQTYEKLKYDPLLIQERRSDIREWVGAEVRVVLEKQTTKNTEPKSLAQSILLSALEVFSE
ncbi:hypothetical protein JXF62_002441 [Salmonella enterica subsp. enterica serovar Braenderup]|nr:hypothetical protein [Salmonella enterica]EGK3198374.1 hypothetical protein [Salmonella enterica]EHB2307609.1 hypothetical protein [Salmonella enterica subsp. enterica serovar Braenderup]